MATTLIDLLRSLVGLTLGGTIGLGFGLIQDAAHRRLVQRQDGGRLSNGWAVMPGSMRRVGYLLAALVSFQIVSPALFADGTQWWVSGGVACGYGATLFWQLRRGRRTHGI